MSKSHRSQVRLGDLSINEEHWGPGSTEPVKRWLTHEYNPIWMPTLVCATIKGREGIWLMGWNNEGTAYPPMIEAIFGKGYAVAQLDQVEAEIAVTKSLNESGLGEYGVGKGES